MADDFVSLLLLSLLSQVGGKDKTFKVLKVNSVGGKKIIFLQWLYFPIVKANCSFCTGDDE